MKLSNKGRYAVRALFDIAYFQDGRATQVKDIAGRQGIPPRFLEQIFQELKRAGIVASKRGPQGGYTLSRRPADVRLGDVIRAVEGPIVLGEPARRSGPEALRAVDAALQELSAQVEACFDAVTVADLCARARELGVSRPGGPRSVYVI